MSDKVDRFALLSVRKQMLTEQLKALEADWLALLREAEIQTALREAEKAEKMPSLQTEPQTEGQPE